MIRMKAFIFCLVSTLYLENAVAQKDTQRDIPINLANEQWEIVAALSGASTIDRNAALKRRWTDKEKMHARNYLRAKFSEIGIQAQDHAYKVDLPHKKASLNPFSGINLFAIVPSSVESEEYIIKS